MIVVSYFLKRLKSSSSLMNSVTFYLILLIVINSLIFNHIVNTQQNENDDDNDLSNELNDPNSINSANYDHEDHFDQHDQQNNNNHNNQPQQTPSSLPTQPDLFENRHESDCYDSKTGAAKKCMPEFINVAYGSKIYASNTCGLSGPTEYCVQTNSHSLYFTRNGNGLYANGDEDLAYLNQQPSISQTPSIDASLGVDQSGRVNSRCQKCDANDRRYSHSAEHLNDYHIQGNLTWWQSDTMLEGIQYPNSVNLTLHFGKSFDINYVQIKFHSPRPESFAIYKRTYEHGPWIPYQYYSASCKETYNVPTLQIIRHGNEAIALCTDEFSDIAPLTGASVVFGTLEDRPSAYNFENSEELKEWVTATDIRITLDRLNTFGDEVFNDPQVLKSYYYAISDIAVGGRCKCNGHASRCELEQQHDFEDRLTCKCEHFTAGVDCNECLPFYNDIPWEPATDLNAHECKPCSCNGLSKKCHFNQTLYDLTGHGGYCDDCEGNTAGPHCEECKVGFYRRENENRCIDCQCNPLGSENVQCDPAGRCRCRPGVIGDKCDRCAPNHYELSTTGCKMCSCNPIGSFDSPPVCDPRDGSCRCKANVEGMNCDKPKPGYFNLDADNIHGALPCFCYGHSSTCNSSTNYFVSYINADFNDVSRLKAIDSRGAQFELKSQPNGVEIIMSQNSQDDVWLLAPSEFLGNQQLSYNQDLAFDIQLVESFPVTNNQPSARPSRKDIVLESSQYNIEVYMPIYGGATQPKYSGVNTLNNGLPTYDRQSFKFQLNQYSGWMPSLSVNDFQKLLSNLSAIKLRVSYAPSTNAIISNLNIKSAKLFSQKTDSDEIYISENGLIRRKELQIAKFVEECKCPVGHVGQHCQFCAEGYRREPVNGGPFARCVPCTCNNHSYTCDPDTGRCNCQHHTSGDNCEKCEHGYYGSSIMSTGSKNDDTIYYSEYDLSNMCKKCPCPQDGACAEIFNYQLQSVEVVCLECPSGTQGNICELCDDGYFNYKSSTCSKCECNGNIDENAIGNCDSSLPFEKCLRCIYNTTGDRCERCLPNYWGHALTSLKCHACECSSLGTKLDRNGRPVQCNLENGQCDCKDNVKNRQCNECKEGFWNLKSGMGCDECKCNPLGSYNFSCDANTGQCFCKPGVQGLKCDSCVPLHYGFSDEGCKKCDCNILGTQYNNLQCDAFGKCVCRENFSGMKCEICNENRYNFTSGCLKCEDCYNLVQEQVNLLRERMKSIQSTLNALFASQSGSNSNRDKQNQDLLRNLKKLRADVDKLHDSLFVDRDLKPNYKETIIFLQNELKRIQEAILSTDQSFNQFNSQFKQAERLYSQANTTILQSQTQLNYIKSKNMQRYERIESIKQSRLDHEQNIKLQTLAKQSRETAKSQEKIAQNFTDLVRNHIRDAQNAFKYLSELAHKYQGLQDDRRLDVFNIDYKMLKMRANDLAAEAIEQKQILGESLKQANEIIKQISNFKDNSLVNVEGETMKLNSNAEETNLKANDVKKKIDELRYKFEKFSNIDSISSIGSAQTQLNNAKIKQRDMDFLFKLAQKTKNESDIASSLAMEVYSNATKILETLEDFDELVTTGKEKLKQAELSRSLTEENNRKMNNQLKEIREKIKELNLAIDDIKKSSSKSSNILNETFTNLDKFTQKVKELRESTSKLEIKTGEVVKNFETNLTPKAKEALNVYSTLNTRSESILKQVEQVTNGTQKLLDNTNNAWFSLNKINKSISEITVANIRKEDIIRLQRKFEQVSAQLDNEGTVDEAISTLEKNTKDLVTSAKRSKIQVEYLRKQVETLELINNSLERKCFKNTIAKPEL